MPFTYPSHQAPVLALKRRWPDLGRRHGALVSGRPGSADMGLAVQGTLLAFDAHGGCGFAVFCVPAAAWWRRLRRVGARALRLVPSPPELAAGPVDGACRRRWAGLAVSAGGRSSVGSLARGSGTGGGIGRLRPILATDRLRRTSRDDERRETGSARHPTLVRRGVRRRPRRGGRARVRQAGGGRIEHGAGLRRVSRRRRHGGPGPGQAGPPGTHPGVPGRLRRRRPLPGPRQPTGTGSPRASFALDADGRPPRYVTVGTRPRRPQAACTTGVATGTAD